MTKSKKPALDIPVEFGGVSIGDGTARLGLTIARASLNIDKADESLCGRRLTGRVVLGNGDASQKELIKDRLHSVASVFDVKRIGVSPKHFSCGLTFSLAEIDVKELSIFAKKSGRLVVEEIAALPDPDDEEEDDEEEEEEEEEEDKEEDEEQDLLDSNGSAKPAGDWRKVAMASLFTGQAAASFGKGKIRTLGDFAEYTNSGKLIRDLPGCGEKTEAKVLADLEKWWAAHPEYADDPVDSIPM